MTSSVCTEKVQIRPLQNTYQIDIKSPFYKSYLLNAYEAYSGNIHIPATIKLTNKDQTLSLHKHFLGFNLTYINVLNYLLMQSLNVTQCTPEQLEKLLHKLFNYTVVNYDLLKEHIQQIDEN